MVKKAPTNKQASSSNQTDPQLLNFHFAPPQRPRSNSNSGSSHHHGRAGGRGGRGGRQQQNKSKNNKSQYHRTAEDRASARRKAASGMFPLHSSPDHAFLIARKLNNDRYTWQGPDQPVPWEAVRIVKYLVSPVVVAANKNSKSGDEAVDSRQQQQQRDISTEICPICLDSMQCARITKCGHCFCLTCLVHHVQSFIDKTTHPKCPCCSIPLHLEDLRPMVLVNVQPPSLKANFRFVKLHRGKDCPAPYLPRPDQPRRSSPQAAPSAGDADAPYSRFNYVDFTAYQQLLEHNHQELLTQQQREGPHMTTLDELCLGLALQLVQQEQHKADEAAANELVLQEQFQSRAAGIYLPQQLHLMYQEAVTTSALSPTAASFSSGAWDDASHHEDTMETSLQVASVSPLRDRTSITGDDDSKDATASPVRRDRGDSIASQGAASACSNTSSTAPRRAAEGGSMYLDEDDEYVLYQAEDGSLCFLAGFNMNCLRTEFSASAPPVFEEAMGNLALDHGEQILPSQQQQQQMRSPPLPDVVEGRVLAIERVNLTADLRQRRRFLSHLPLYSDLCFVEISLGHILSNRTKKAFKNEFQKRNQARLNQVKAEQRADERERRKEQARINELKARMQRIDPTDEFFQPVVSPIEPEPALTGDAFGPTISGPNNSASQTADGDNPIVGETDSQAPSSSSMSFSQIIRAGEAFPTLGSAPNETNFPALGSSPPTGVRRAPAPRPWGNSVKAAPAAAAADAALDVPVASSPQRGGKKAKSKKIVLFSTGSQRGGNY